jgi:hypothetical protein
LNLHFERSGYSLTVPGGLSPAGNKRCTARASTPSRVSELDEEPENAGFDDLNCDRGSQMRPTLRLVGMLVLAGSAALLVTDGAEAGWRTGNGGFHSGYGGFHGGYGGYHAGYSMHGYGAHNYGGWGGGLAQASYAHRYGGVNYYSARRARYIAGGVALGAGVFGAGVYGGGAVYGAGGSYSDSPYYGPGVGAAEVAPTYSQGYQTAAPVYSGGYQTAEPYPAQTYERTYSVPTTVYQNVTRSYTVPVHGYRTVAQTHYVPVTSYREITSEVEVPVTTYQTYQRTEQVPTTVYHQVHKVCGCSYSQ